MAIDLKLLEISDEFGNQVTDFPLANVGDKQNIKYKITVSSYAINDLDNPMIANYTNGTVGNYWLYDPSGQFAAIKIGDVLQNKDYSNNVQVSTNINVIDKLNNSLIRIDQDLAAGQLNYALGTNIFNVITPITAIKYYYNFLENSANNNYNSKVDGSLQMLAANVISAASIQTSGALVVGRKYRINDFNVGDDFTNVGAASNATGVIFTATGTTPTIYSNGSTLGVCYDMVFQGNKPYQIGSATIAADGIDTDTIYGSKFIIEHSTYLTPFFLSDQWTDLVSGINPSYDLNGECLKLIHKWEAMFNYNDPNRMLTYESSLDVNANELGNTGGFNENFNTGLTNYSVDSVTYHNAASEEIDTLELTTDETTVTIVIKNTADTPFSNNNTKFSLNFIRAPYDSSEYQNNTKTQAQNFCFDKAINTVGSASVDGDNYGTDYQVLKDVAATFNTTGQITITAKIAFNANVLTEITQSAEYRYLLWVSVQNHTKTVLNSDRVSLLADIDTFFVDASDPGMIVTNNMFLEHPYSNPVTHSVESIDPCVEDEVVALSRFYIDKDGRESDEIVITSVECKVIALNTTNNDQFTLERMSVNTVGSQIINDLQYIDVTIPRVFHIPTTEIRKNFKVLRRPDLDDATKFYYDVTYPFKVRWEDYLQLLGVNSNFYNNALPHLGFNNQWFRYANSSIDQWETYYEINVNATKNGTPLQFTTRTVFSIDNYSPEEDDYIKTFTSDFTTELYNSTTDKWYIKTDEDTGVEAVFEMDSGFNLAYCFVVFFMEAYQNGGISEVRRYSSVNVQTADTYFKSIAGNDLISKSAPNATTLRARCLINKDTFPGTNPAYQISARLFYIDPPLTVSKIREEGKPKFKEDGSVKSVE